MNQSPSHVLGTAGHVDHGKSSLLRALTGMEPSRLAEEQRRGMTIELGFVWLTHNDGSTTGFIDVPGHKDFRATMISGATGINGFVFCVAADDGWMPQSEDHLRILSALNIHQGVCVLTKTDLVTGDRVEELKSDLTERFAATCGRPIPIVPFSAQTNAGLDELRSAISQLIRELPGQDVDHEKPFFLPDRVFSLKGHGTIMTGTLRHGALHVKDRVRLVPAGTSHSIKGMHRYGLPVGDARATTRVAIQLSDVEQDSLKEGQQVIRLDSSQVEQDCATMTIDARLSYFSERTGRHDKARRVLILHGGLKTDGCLVPALEEQSPGDERFFARLHLETPRWIRFGDPLIILTSGADHLLAAGRVIDGFPPKKPGIRKAASHFVAAGIDTDWGPGPYVALKARQSSWIDGPEIARHSPWDQATIMEAAKSLGRLDVRGTWILTRDIIPSTKERLLGCAADALTKDAALKGVTIDSLAKATQLPAGIAALLVDDLCREGRMLRETGLFLLPGRERQWSVSESRHLQRITQALDETEPHAWTLLELDADTAEGRKILRAVVDDGKAVRLSDKHFMGARAFESVAGRVIDRLQGGGTLSTAQLRDHLGLGRKLVILIAETMDRLGYTSRSGDDRSLLKPMPRRDNH